MSKKSQHIAEFIARFSGGGLSPHYLGYFDCFNRQRFYEAHDVLEELWLADRHGPDGDFYKGLIQLAGAFVHVQKNRPGPACALLRLAGTYLGKYPAVYHQLELTSVAALIETWLRLLAAGPAEVNRLLEKSRPTLALRS